MKNFKALNISHGNSLSLQVSVADVSIAPTKDTDHIQNIQDKSNLKLERINQLQTVQVLQVANISEELQVEKKS